MSENHYCRTVRLKADPMASAMDAASENGKVRCMECGNLVDRDSEDYVQIMGNILIGEHGGIVGNNFGADGMLKKSSCICRRKKCLMAFLKQLMPQEGPGHDPLHRLARYGEEGGRLSSTVRDILQDIRTGRLGREHSHG